MLRFVNFYLKFVDVHCYLNTGSRTLRGAAVFLQIDILCKAEYTYIVTYDAQGNPTNYMGKTAVWEKGRQLKSFDGVTFTYNANGIRTSKTLDGRTHTYTLDGTKILEEYWVGNALIPLYDNEDNVCGITYNGTPYYFLKNLQGDVIAITDKNGDVVARYTYDAWGLCTIVSDTSGRSIATVNPFRYRGYYYDNVTCLYYLQSRYYDPKTGRFINADKPETILAFRGTLFANLTGYCINNPISFYDYKGEYPVLVGAGLQVSFSVSFGGISVGAGFELIYFWASKFSARKTSRCLVYFYIEPLNFNFASLKNAINISTYYNKMKFNPKKLISKPSFNAAVSILTLWADHKKSFSYKDYEGRFDTWTFAAWGARAFKSWSSIFTVYGAGKYWGLSGSGVSRSVSNYWMVYDLGNSMKQLMDSIKKQGQANA